MTHKMIAFHGDPKIKEKYLARVQAHRIADEIIHGDYWVNGKGCAVGCTVHSNQHRDYETELGIPVKLARLEDWLFENMANGNSMTWPERFLEAPAVGADLNLVWSQFAEWLLVDAEWGVIKFAKTDRTRAAIQGVADLYQKMNLGELITSTQFASAASAADAADAAYAADAASAADAKAQREHVLRMADKLLELMAAAPVAELVAA